MDGALPSELGGADYAVSLKTGQLALQLIERSDDGIAKAEELSQQTLRESKAGTTP